MAFSHSQLYALNDFYIMDFSHSQLYTLNDFYIMDFSHSQLYALNDFYIIAFGHILVKMVTKRARTVIFSGAFSTHLFGYTTLPVYLTHLNGFLLKSMVYL